MGISALPSLDDWLELHLEGADALLLEPRAHFDGAVVGYLEHLNVLVYSAPRVIAALMRERGMSNEDAVEWFDFNIAGARGEGYPLFLWPAPGEAPE